MTEWVVRCRWCCPGYVRVCEIERQTTRDHMPVVLVAHAVVAAARV